MVRHCLQDSKVKGGRWSKLRCTRTKEILSEYLNGRRKAFLLSLSTISILSQAFVFTKCYGKYTACTSLVLDSSLFFPALKSTVARKYSLYNQ